MSVENLKEYARRCATDPELRAVAKEIGISDLDEHMRHSESMGLDWDRGDLVAFWREMTDSGEGDLADLSEEELEEIAGGGATTTAAVAIGVAVGAAAGAAVGAAAVGGGVGAAAAAGRGGW